MSIIWKTGYVESRQGSKSSHKVMKTGYVMTLREENEVRIAKSADIDAITNQGYSYY